MVVSAPVADAGGGAPARPFGGGSGRERRATGASFEADERWSVRSAFAGRHAELAALEQRFAEAVAGRGSFVGLAGDAGIGKTRILEELVARAAIPDERSLLLYADAKTTREVEEMLVKLGEVTSKKPSVIRLKETNCTETAKMLREVFNGPKGNETSRVTIVPVPEENVLLVYATPIDTLTIRTLLGKVIDATGVDPAKPAPEPNRIVGSTPSGAGALAGSPRLVAASKS